MKISNRDLAIIIGLVVSVLAELDRILINIKVIQDWWDSLEPFFRLVIIIIFIYLINEVLKRKK